MLFLVMFVKQCKALDTHIILASRIIVSLGQFLLDLVASKKLPYCVPSFFVSHLSLPFRNNSEWRNEEVHIVKPMRSASCPNSETLGLLRVPHPPTQPSFTAPYLYSTTSSSTLPISPSDPSLKTLQGGQVWTRGL